MIQAASMTAMERQAGRFYGKYRGIVKDNNDPLGQGRLRAIVPDVLQDIPCAWALPAAPYAGPGAGQFTVPPRDAGVWIEFEAGDTSRPIWSGCWWGPREAPADEKGTPATPPTKILRSDRGLLIALNDAAQTITLSDAKGANLVTIRVSEGNVRIQSAVSVVLEAPLIQHGENAVEPAVFGNKLLAYLNDLVVKFNAHVHPGQLAAGFIPVTPSPPVPPFPAAAPSLVSGKVKVE
jgi:hypothetical protein